jgi:hypothetical protein
VTCDKSGECRAIPLPCVLGEHFVGHCGVPVVDRGIFAIEPLPGNANHRGSSPSDPLRIA